MKLYKEDKFLVLSKEIAFNHSLDTITAMLEQLGIIWQTTSFEIEPYTSDWDTSADAENATEKFLQMNPWLEEYKVVQDSNLGYSQYREIMQQADYQPQIKTFYTNLESFQKIGRQPDYEQILNLTKNVSVLTRPESMHFGLEGLCTAAEEGNSLVEPARFSRNCAYYPDNYFTNMIGISKHSGTTFFRAVLRLETDSEGKLSESFSRLEQRCMEMLGTLTESRYTAAYTEEEMADFKLREAGYDEQLSAVIYEAKTMVLPHTPGKTIAPTAKGCSVKKAFTGAFRDTGFEFLDSKNFCLKASKKSDHGFIYRITIDYGGHIWHAHTIILEVHGINFSRCLLRIDGLTPQSQEECQMNLENFKIQAMHLIGNVDPILCEEYGETPKWFSQYRKYY